MKSRAASQPTTSRLGSARKLIATAVVMLVLAASAAVVSPSSVIPQPASPWSQAGWEDASALDNYNPKDHAGSMYWVTGENVYALAYWNDGYTGQGVDVAVVDTGVVPVPGLNEPGKVINGPDLSFESQSPDHHYLDTYGHGTHIAGIIAGRDGDLDEIFDGDERFNGMAPGARIVNVKVGDHEGSVDISQVIAAIDWVVEHKNDNGLNIRILNLSYGTDSVQEYQVDPLAFAVERAWKAGIVVVVAAGNDGNASPLRNPATSPYVITVGASVPSDSYGAQDDEFTSFSSCGIADRNVDIVAPGKSIVSLRNPGSSADTDHPEAVVADRYFLGSGTSQAAAVVSGAAALIIEQRPSITPDQLKKLLTDTAEPIPGVSTACQGAGLVDLKEARDTRTPRLSKSTQTWAASTGEGSLEDARGSIHVAHDGVALIGEQDIFGATWNPDAYTTASTQGTSWSGGDWNGTSWSGTSWSGTSWSGTSWSGTSWSGTSWSGTSWSGTSWSNQYWTGTSWSGTSWSGTSWSGTSWSGTSWSGDGWLGLSWG